MAYEVSWFTTKPSMTMRFPFIFNYKMIGKHYRDIWYTLMGYLFGTRGEGSRKWHPLLIAGCLKKCSGGYFWANSFIPRGCDYTLFDTFMGYWGPFLL